MAEQDGELLEVKLITTFNDLPSELILCIFKYLSVPERYESFFDYDTRFRQLVKRWTSYNRKALDADIERFSTLHSWYKNLSFENGGVECVIIPQVGQQPRYSFDPRISDTTGLHWFFLFNYRQRKTMDERVREILLRNSFRLNPFFYHLELGISSRLDLNGQQSRCIYDGGHIIAMDRYRKYFEPWIRSNYSELADRILNISEMDDDIDEALAPIFEAEWLKAQQAIRKAAYRIWEELKSLEDFNPLKILDIL